MTALYQEQGKGAQGITQSHENSPHPARAPTAPPRGQFSSPQFLIDQQLLATVATLRPCGQIPQPRASGHLPLPQTEIVLVA